MFSFHIIIAIWMDEARKEERRGARKYTCMQRDATRRRRELGRSNDSTCCTLSLVLLLCWMNWKAKPHACFMLVLISWEERREKEATTWWSESMLAGGQSSTKRRRGGNGWKGKKERRTRDGIQPCFCSPYSQSPIIHVHK
jgi:hypothetical protein